MGRDKATNQLKEYADVHKVSSVNVLVNFFKIIS